METCRSTDGSVSAIVAVFKESLAEFTTYRERKRKLKRTNAAKYKTLHGKKGDCSSGDELRLSKSLRAGVLDVQKEYDEHFQVLGNRYALGDSLAHSSLGRTLRKLNNCLRNIIASILSFGSYEYRINYKHLASISDISRLEALETLSQLSYRMSQSNLSLQQLRRDEKQRKHDNESGRNKPKRKLRNAVSEANLTERSRQQKSKDKKEPEVRKVQLKSKSTPKLMLVRPAARRSSSSKSGSSVSLQTPPPAYSPGLPSVLPSDDPHMKKSPRPIQGQHHELPCPSPQLVGHHHSQPVPAQQSQPPHPPTAQHTTPPPTGNRRRENAHTASIYTFASGSTRLGEIPENRWATPMDYDEMARLNRAHGGGPWPPPADAVAAKPKRGFFGLFKKGQIKTDGIVTA